MEGCKVVVSLGKCKLLLFLQCRDLWKVILLLIFSLLQKPFHQCNLLMKKHTNLFTIHNHFTIIIVQCQFGFQVAMLFDSYPLKWRPFTKTSFGWKAQSFCLPHLLLSGVVGILGPIYLMVLMLYQKTTQKLVE
jgi:hypothetical protein